MQSLAVLTLLAGSLLLAAAPARAEVVHQAADGFRVKVSVVTPARPASAFARFAQVSRWWRADHTYSGDAGNLRLDLAPDGCFCEVWEGGAVAHARTLMALPGRLVRLEGAFGPLQETGAHGVWTVTFAPEAEGSRITADYVVSGAAGLKLERFAKAVDEVLGAQIASLAASASTSVPAP